MAQPTKFVGGSPGAPYSAPYCVHYTGLEVGGYNYIDPPYGTVTYAIPALSWSARNHTATFF